MGSVSIQRCADYSEQNIAEALEKCFNDIGGVEKYIKPGMKVLLKPNLVMKKDPAEAATTHPALIKVLCGIIRRVGASAIIADSPGGVYSEKVLKSLYAVCGMSKVGENAILNYDTSSVDIDVPDGKLLKKVTIIKPLADADLVINLPKLKTHGQMVYTGAVKNMFGAVPGALKAEYHFRMQNYEDFADALIDIFLSIKPGLTIMDAVYGMEGEGPTAGTPRYIGALLAGENAFEVDLAALKLIKVKPGSVPLIKQAIRRGLCPEDINSIKIFGGNIDEMVIDNFNVPGLNTLRAIEFFDKGIIKFAINRIKPKPVFNHGKCVGCGDCMSVCPAGVIRMNDGKPSADLSKCIRCFCCQELCPIKAINIKRSSIIKLISGRTR